MKIALIFTNDWELFGDGSGDYFEVQHNPTIELFDLLEKYNSKMTFMAEVMQQLTMKKHINKISGTEKITDSWESIMKKAVSKGHDVQLHIHPQWINSSYSGGSWELDMAKSSIAQHSIDTISNTLNVGKRYLDTLLKEVKPKYECICFRAGGYYIEPSEKVIPQLIANGFKCDTTVTKGLKSGAMYDFTNAYSNVLPWFVDKKDIKKKSSITSNLIELPIYSKKSWSSQALEKFFPKIYYSIKYRIKLGDEWISWRNEKERVKELRYPKSKRFYKSVEKRNLKWYMSKFINSEYLQLDYDFIPAEAFVKIIKGIFFENDLKNVPNNDHLFIPIVATGHIKDVHNLYNLEIIHRLVDNELGDRVEFWTLSQAYEYVKSHKEFFQRS